MKAQLEQTRIFNAFSNSLSKIKDGACIINLDDYKSIGTHWIALYVNEESNIL